MDQVNYLKDADIYESLSEGELICMAKQTHNELKKKDNLLYAPGDCINHIYVIKSGEVHLYHEVGGKRVIFDVLTPGTVFGAFDGEASKAVHYAEVSRDAQICVAKVEDFLALIKERPDLLLSLMKVMAARIRDYEQKLEVASGTASEKILFELRRQKERRSKNFWGKLFPVKLYFTHEQLAALTGLNRITVTRELGKLREEGKITVEEGSGAMDVL